MGRRRIKLSRDVHPEIVKVMLAQRKTGHLDWKVTPMGKVRVTVDGQSNTGNSLCQAMAPWLGTEPFVT